MKAKLPDGTIVEGTMDEVRQYLSAKGVGTSNNLPQVAEKPKPEGEALCEEFNAWLAQNYRQPSLLWSTLKVALGKKNGAKLYGFLTYKRLERVRRLLPEFHIDDHKGDKHFIIWKKDSSVVSSPLPETVQKNKTGTIGKGTHQKIKAQHRLEEVLAEMRRAAKGVTGKITTAKLFKDIYARLNIGHTVRERALQAFKEAKPYGYRLKIKGHYIFVFPKYKRKAQQPAGGGTENGKQQ